jgi:Entner-Doudoroff aldolase
MSDRGNVATAGGSDAFFEAHFTGRRVMAILRDYDPARTAALAEHAWDLGIALVEVPVHTQTAFASFEAAAAVARKRGAVLGAGTVYRVEQVERLVELGAHFAVAAGFDVPVARRCRELGLPYLPGVASATEIQGALLEGYHWCKAFPARELTPAWIRAMRAPFPQVAFVATGGIDATNAEQFLAVGARGVAVGSALEDATQLDRLAGLLDPDVSPGAAAR